jgi:hypothetical protein
MFTKPPFDSAINQRNQKEQMKAIELKEQIKMLKKDEDKNHLNIIKIGDRVPKKVNMGDFTVVSPTSPIYLEINEHQAQYYIFKTMEESYICFEMTFHLLKLCLSFQI